MRHVRFQVRALMLIRTCCAFVLTDFPFARPPEQVSERHVNYQNRSGYDEKVDWFSLGVTTYAMICGRRPFPSKKDVLRDAERKSGVSSPSASRRRSSLSDHGPTSARVREATRRLMRDIEYRCLMSDVSFPAHVEDLRAQDFIQQLLARDPNERPSFGELRSHPWFDDLTLEADSLLQQDVPAFVHTHVRQEESRPRLLRRNSLANSSKNECALSKFIEDICVQMMSTGRSESKEVAERWLTAPTEKTNSLFRHWGYVSGDALRLELSAQRSESRRAMRRATTQ